MGLANRKYHLFIFLQVLTFNYRFLWKFEGTGPRKLKVFRWTGKNDYVALCEPEYLSFGGG